MRMRVPRATLRLRLLVLGIATSLSVLLLVGPPTFSQAGPISVAARHAGSPAASSRPHTAPPRSSTSVHGVAEHRASETPHASAPATSGRGPTLGPSSTPIPNGSTSGAFVGRSGTQLTLNGEPYRFTGINIYMAASGGTPSSCGGELYPDVGVPLSDMPRGIVFRFWAFQDFFVSRGSFNWTNFDQVLSIAADHGDKVIPVLANQHEYCDGAGKDLAWYQSGYRTTLETGDIVTYRQYVSEVAARYADNPTVAMWQLVNEGQALNANGTCAEPAALSALLAFSYDVGGLVHSIDRNHLVSEGTPAGWNGSGLGQYCGAANDDFQTLMASPGTDVCDFHDYGYPTDPMGGPLARILIGDSDVSRRQQADHGRRDGNICHQ